MSIVDDDNMQRERANRQRKKPKIHPGSTQLINSSAIHDGHSPQGLRGCVKGQGCEDAEKSGTHNDMISRSGEVSCETIFRKWQVLSFSSHVPHSDIVLKSGAAGEQRNFRGG